MGTAYGSMTCVAGIGNSTRLWCEGEFVNLVFVTVCIFSQPSHLRVACIFSLAGSFRKCAPRACIFSHTLSPYGRSIKQEVEQRTSPDS
eukprot:scaffold39950_cov72-Phaeocystis_antarctica.AAC.2